MAQEDEDWLSGRMRPPNIPDDWIGEPLLDGRGWRWFDPQDRGNIVRFYRGDPQAEHEVDRSTYVVVTVKGEILDREGNPTGEFLHD